MWEAASAETAFPSAQSRCRISGTVTGNSSTLKTIGCWYGPLLRLGSCWSGWWCGGGNEMAWMAVAALVEARGDERATRRGRPRRTSPGSCAATSHPSAALHSGPAPLLPSPIQDSAQCASAVPPRAPASAATFQPAQTRRSRLDPSDRGGCGGPAPSAPSVVPRRSVGAVPGAHGPSHRSAVPSLLRLLRDAATLWRGCGRRCGRRVAAQSGQRGGRRGARRS
jgi:hypothetical protein